MIYRLATAVAGVVLVAAAAEPSFDAALSCSALPGFERSGAGRLYEGENLYEYMDGNSEGYLIYGFNRMRGITCARGDERVLIDISEMQDDESAYGLFSSQRDPRLPTENIGAAGQVVERRAFFVKGKYFVEIAAQSQRDYSGVLRKAAESLANHLQGSATAPEPIGWFELDGLTDGPPRLIPQSVLGIRALKRGYVAQYGSAKEFVIIQQRVDAAREIVRQLLSKYETVGEAQVGDEGYQTVDPYVGTIVIARKGPRLAGCAAPTRAEALARTAKLIARLP